MTLSHQPTTHTGSVPVYRQETGTSAGEGSVLPTTSPAPVSTPGSWGARDIVAFQLRPDLMIPREMAAFPPRMNPPVTPSMASEEVRRQSEAPMAAWQPILRVILWLALAALIGLLLAPIVGKVLANIAFTVQSFNCGAC